MKRVFRFEGMIDTNIEAKVKVVNEVHKLANHWMGVTLAFMTPFVGKKITKADGSCTKKFSEARKELDFPSGDYDAELRVIGNRVLLTCSGRDPHESYHWTDRPSRSVNVLIATLDYDGLVQLANPKKFNENYYTQEVAILFKELDDTRKKLRELEGTLSPFV